MDPGSVASLTAEALVPPADPGAAPRRARPARRRLRRLRDAAGAGPGHGAVPSGARGTRPRSGARHGGARPPLPHRRAAPAGCRHGIPARHARGPSPGRPALGHTGERVGRNLDDAAGERRVDGAARPAPRRDGAQPALAPLRARDQRRAPRVGRRPRPLRDGAGRRPARRCRRPPHRPVGGRPGQRPAGAQRAVRAAVGRRGGGTARLGATWSRSARRATRAAVHRDGVRRILALHGQDETALRNVAALPLGDLEREEWLRTGH